MVDPTSPVLIEPTGRRSSGRPTSASCGGSRARNGFDCYVQAEPFSGVDQGYFQTRSLSGSPEAVLNVELGEDDSNVSDFSDPLRRGEADDGEGERARPEQRTRRSPATRTSTQQPPLGLGGDAARARSATAIVLPSDLGLTQSGDLQKAAQAIADRSTWAVVACGDGRPRRRASCARRPRRTSAASGGCSTGRTS